MLQKHIVLVSPLFNYVRGGAEINDLNLGYALSRLGHKVTYLVGLDNIQNRHNTPTWATLIEVPTLGFDWNEFSAVGISGKGRRFRFFRAFAKQICLSQRQCLNDSDFILLTGRPSLAQIVTVTSAPVIHSVRGEMGRFNEWFVRYVDGLIFWGGCEADNPPRLFAKKPALLVDPGVDETYFHPGAGLPQLEHSLRRGDAEALNVVFAGRLDPIKRVEHIIRAVGSAINQGRSVYLSIVGDGSVRADLERLAETHLPGRVTFHGRQEPSSLADILRASDVFMLTSHMENHPIAIKEALACGLDVIAYGVGRVPQILSGQANSVVVPVGDESALAETLLQRVDKGRIPAKQRTASNAGTWRDVAEKIVSWREKELKHRG
ncbi:glycosyltransferase [Spiribacter roseus]|uniref:glycosyltransferase n=1 Tax=Spiribacter roseus TaxID=1855875 RepID=UPI001330A699|nr:glycosyltransferase [Spiribacter roseus]